MKIYIIIGGANGDVKSTFTQVLKERTTDLGTIIVRFVIESHVLFLLRRKLLSRSIKVAEYRNGEFRTVGMHSPNWILDLQNFLIERPIFDQQQPYIRL